MKRALVALCAAMVAGSGWAQVSVPTAPAAGAKAQKVHDWRYGVRFTVPTGWSYAKKDGVVSTFRLDARSVGVKTRMRGVASMEFNPLPQSTLAGATMYYSVEPKTTEVECAAQASTKKGRPDVVDIGGMDFTHGHDEHGGICVEARDEIYTAYRKHSCYRFDLVVNTFCAESSGAQELSKRQLQGVLERMTAMLSTVVFTWEKSGAREVPVPRVSASR
ncbi:MAG: hypothetical protein V4555_10710 [Acidobacteriota bacterium]